MYNLIVWFSPKLSNYPKKYKYTLGDRILSIKLDILERIIEAKYTSRKKEYFLRQANILLEKLRFLIRLSKDLNCISIKQYEETSKRINEIGKMVGGWEKHIKKGSVGNGKKE